MKKSDCYTFYQGNSPLLVSIPHDGRILPPDIANLMTSNALSLPDTDWNVSRLYQFCKVIDASMIIGKYSRYVVDLNRSDNDELLYKNNITTGICPSNSFDGNDLYKDNKIISATEKQQRIKFYWLPYHNKIKSCLKNIKNHYGYALLWDAHSIQSEIPSLFPGKLPDLNIGTNDQKSCSIDAQNAVISTAKDSPYSVAVNDRFKGGYITRCYGIPEKNQYAIQLELAQSCYMDEHTLDYDIIRAEKLVNTLRKMLLMFANSVD